VLGVVVAVGVLDVDDSERVRLLRRAGRNRGVPRNDRRLPRVFDCAKGGRENKRINR